MSQPPSTARIFWNSVFILLAIPLVTLTLLAFRSRELSPTQKLRGSTSGFIVRIPYTARGYDESNGYDDLHFGAHATAVSRESSDQQTRTSVNVSPALSAEMTSLMATWCTKVLPLPTPRPDRMYYVTMACPGRFNSHIRAFNIDADHLPPALDALIALIPSLEH